MIGKEIPLSPGNREVTDGFFLLDQADHVSRKQLAAALFLYA